MAASENAEEGFWQNVESDLWAQSEFEKPAHLKARSRNEPTPGGLSLNESRQPSVKMVRGRPVKVYHDPRPGGNHANKNIKLIREVCPLGFSNELIEETIKRQRSLPMKNNNEDLPDLAFVKSTIKPG